MEGWALVGKMLVEGLRQFGEKKVGIIPAIRARRQVSQ